MVNMLTRKSQKNVIFAGKTLGATDLKLGMYKRLNSESNKGWVPPDHTSSFHCLRLKMPKIVFQYKKILEPREIDP